MDDITLGRRIQIGINVTVFLLFVVGLVVVLNAKTVIDDCPSDLTDISDDGALTVTVRQRPGPVRAYLTGIGRLGPEDGTALKKFLEDQLPDRMISAALCDDGRLDVLYYDPKGSVQNLSEEFGKILRTRRGF